VASYTRMSLAVVTGASGLLGGNLAAELIAAGHRVRATRRGSTKIDHLADLAIEWADADLADAPALAKACAGADVVFHCAAQVSVRKGVSRALEAANVGGTANVLAAVRDAKVPRLVHCSSVVAVGLSTDGHPCTEASAWNFPDFGLDDGYAITKHCAEELVRAAPDLDAVIVNPTYMFGPRDARPSSGQLIVDIAKRKLPGWSPGFNNFVDVRDVARSMIAAWLRGRRGERYILGGHEMTYREVIVRIAELCGVRPPRLGMPRLLAAAVGRFGDLVERVSTREPLLNSTTVRYAYTDRFRFSHAKAARELDHAPGPIEPAIVDAIAWMRARSIM